MPQQTSKVWIYKHAKLPITPEAVYVKAVLIFLLKYYFWASSNKGYNSTARPYKENSIKEKILLLELACFDHIIESRS